MWIPKTEDEIIQAVTSGSLEESTIFDAKKELPSKNPELAKDIAAMANEGGVLVYGIAEDKDQRPTVLTPIPLAGQAERVNSIVQTSIAEPPTISISAIPTAADRSIGYLVVVVPPSPRAPHMVIVKGDHRYYRRTATGNTLLSEGEVARLYERRQRWEVDRDGMLSEEMQSAPIEPRKGFAYLYLVARPVFRSEDLLDRAAKQEPVAPDFLHKLIYFALRPDFFSSDYSPHFGPPNRWIRRTEGFLGKLYYPPQDDDPRAPAYILNLQVDFDGSGHLFCGRAGESRQEDEPCLIFPSAIAGNTTRFLALLGRLYDLAGYVGPVDLGLALTGLKGGYPEIRSSWGVIDARPYDRNEYRRTDRVTALALKDDPIQVARTLLTPLFRALSSVTIDPFPKKA